MNEDDRKLMISMAKAIETQGQAILELQKSERAPLAAITGAMSELKAMDKAGIESKISFEKQKQHLIMDVQFEGAELLSFEDRQKRCQQFLGDMRGLLEDYKVVKMHGSYVR